MVCLVRVVTLFVLLFSVSRPSFFRVGRGAWHTQRRSMWPQFAWSVCGRPARHKRAQIPFPGPSPSLPRPTAAFSVAGSSPGLTKAVSWPSKATLVVWLLLGVSLSPHPFRPPVIHLPVCPSITRLLFIRPSVHLLAHLPIVCCPSVHPSARVCPSFRQPVVCSHVHGPSVHPFAYSSVRPCRSVCVAEWLKNWWAMGCVGGCVCPCGCLFSLGRWGK